DREKAASVKQVILDDGNFSTASLPGTWLEAWQTLRSDGSWANIDYADQTRAGWRVAKHLSRLMEMCAAWAVKDSPAYHHRELGSATRRALDYWFAADRRCVNWWYNEIFVPRCIGRIAILGRKLFDAGEMELLRGRLLEAAFGMTGQNRVWRAEAVMLAGIVEKNLAKINRAHREIAAELKFSCDEGIRYDGAFHQHGRQIQFGNYGLSFLQSLADAAHCFAGTCWQFSAAELAPLRHVVVNGMKWVLYKDVMDLQAQGRQLWQDSQREKYTIAATSLQLLAEADKSYRKRYAAPISGNKMFFNSDLMIHRRENFYLSCRANSIWTRPVETVVNFDNLLGQYFSDGCVLLMCSGREYYNICGCWDWTRLPGTTAPATPRYSAKESEAHGYTFYHTFPPVTHSCCHRHAGSTNFTGGVSDGINGAMVYTMDLDNVQAKKTLFCAGDLIVALGSGIDSTSPYPVATTVEQSLLQGDIQSGKNWFCHNGIGYYGENMQLFAGKRQGDWQPVFGGLTAPVPDEKEIFQLTIEHGTGGHDGTYCYALLPGADGEKTAKAAELFTVLANNRKIQAVRFADGTVMAVFHEAGSLETALPSAAPAVFTASAPGIFIIGKEKIHAADPSRRR
ncbi:MAG: hypothetical protein IKD22_02815, partial [Lentisphaeria bacterium]|nr:hypothetical protein [Lentisphaeria bacterium]